MNCIESLEKQQGTVNLIAGCNYFFIVSSKFKNSGKMRLLPSSRLPFANLWSVVQVCALIYLCCGVTAASAASLTSLKAAKAAPKAAKLTKANDNDTVVVEVPGAGFIRGMHYNKNKTIAHLGLSLIRLRKADKGRKRSQKAD